MPDTLARDGSHLDPSPWADTIFQDGLLSLAELIDALNVGRLKPLFINQISGQAKE